MVVVLRYCKKKPWKGTESKGTKAISDGVIYVSETS